LDIESKYATLFTAIKRGDSPILYIPKFREFGLQVLNPDGIARGDVYDLVQYCPFTGEKLPSSLRDKWFDKLDELKIEPDSPDVPEEMQTDKWLQSEA
jgi:hypothetical protein